MIKLSIEKIEKQLNKKIRRNALGIGFDVAEKYTGVCLLKANDKYLYIEDLQVIETSAKDDHFHRADHYVSSLEKFKQELNKYKTFKILVIERCYYGRNVETLIHLAHFGILTYITLRKNVDDYHYIGATTARSIIGFNQKRQAKLGNVNAGVYTRDTKNKKGKLLHKKGEKKTVKCKILVHDYLKTDFGLTFGSEDKADGFVLSLAGLLM